MKNENIGIMLLILPPLKNCCSYNGTSCKTGFCSLSKENCMGCGNFK